VEDISEDIVSSGSAEEAARNLRKQGVATAAIAGPSLAERTD
jgi:hypothetical protein